MLRPMTQPDPRHLSILREAGPQLGAGELFVSDKSGAEWHGTLEGFPLRILAKSSTGGPTLTVKVPKAHGLLVLEYGVGYVVRDQGVPRWSASTDPETVVFVADGVFIRDKGDIDRQIGLFEYIPSDATRAICDAVVREQILQFSVGEIMETIGKMVPAVMLRGRDELVSIREPAAWLVRTGKLLGWFARGLMQMDLKPELTGAVTVGAAASLSAAAVPTTRCAYCRTAFLLSQSKMCPNCGAPPQT